MIQVECRLFRTIVGALALISAGVHAYESEDDKKYQYTATGGIGHTSINFGESGPSSPAMEKYLEDLSSGTTFTGQVRIDYFKYASVSVELNYFNSSAAFSDTLSENMTIVTPSLGLFGKYPVMKTGIEVYAGAGIGFVIFEDKVEMSGAKITLSSPQPGYRANLGLDYFPIKYLGIGLGIAQHWSSVDDIYSNYGDHVELQKDISLNRTEFRANLSTRFFLGTPKGNYR